MKRDLIYELCMNAKQKKEEEEDNKKECSAGELNLIRKIVKSEIKSEVNFILKLLSKLM